MKKVILAISLIFLVLFLASCTPQDGQMEEMKDADGMIPEDSEVAETTQLPAGECEPHWECISSSTKAYQQEDCSWVERKDCPLGCFNGSCRQGNTCDPGFKCKDENTKGYQTEVCYWNNEKGCEWGCSDGECNPKPENYTEPVAEETVVEEEEEPAVPQKNVQLINGGDTQTINDQEFSVYLIEESRTKLKLGEQKSDWLMEGESYTFSDGTKITVESILFQVYEGGIKAVEYSVG